MRCISCSRAFLPCSALSGRGPSPRLPTKARSGQNLVIDVEPADAQAASHRVARRLGEAGGRLALERLVPLVEAELRRLSRYYLRRERKGQRAPD